jgi:hypothetical protein
MTRSRRTRPRFDLRQASGIAARSWPTIQPFDQDAWAKPYAAYTLAQSRAAFDALRAWNAALIGALSEADRRKKVMHPERGEETVWTIVEIMAGHDLHHLRSLEASTS